MVFLSNFCTASLTSRTVDRDPIFALEPGKHSATRAPGTDSNLQSRPIQIAVCFCIPIVMQPAPPALYTIPHQIRHVASWIPGPVWWWWSTSPYHVMQADHEIVGLGGCSPNILCICSMGPSASDRQWRCSEQAAVSVSSPISPADGGCSTSLNHKCARWNPGLTRPWRNQSFLQFLLKHFSNQSICQHVVGFDWNNFPMINRDQISQSVD